MMDGRERTIHSVEFGKPDRIPLNIWIHNATALKYGGKLGHDERWLNSSAANRLCDVRNN
jgi:hypothetical protein